MVNEPERKSKKNSYWFSLVQFSKKRQGSVGFDVITVEGPQAETEIRTNGHGQQITSVEEGETEHVIEHSGESIESNEASPQSLELSQHSRGLPSNSQSSSGQNEGQCQTGQNPSESIPSVKETEIVLQEDVYTILLIAWTNKVGYSI